MPFRGISPILYLFDFAAREGGGLETIWVGMSGGVDSSVAAALLLEQGHTVVGVTLRLREGAQGDVDDARRVCDALDIEHRVIDLTDRFSGCVMDEFARE